MKCKGCGATFDPQMEYCPYCGTENSKQKRRREALERRQARYHATKEQVLENSLEEIRLRKVNRLMWIMAGLLGFMMIVLVAYFSLEDKIWYEEGHVEETRLEEFRQQQHWGAMLDYLYENDTDTSEEYYDYWQLAIFAEAGVALRYYRDEYMTLERDEYRAAFLGHNAIKATDREWMIQHYDFLVERILQDCIDILGLREEYTGDSWRAEIYGPITKEADSLLTEFEAEAHATLSTVFSMSDQEIEELCQIDYLYGEEAERYIKRIKEDWLNE